MNWQRTARVIVALIGIGAAVAIVTYSRRGPAPAPRPPELAKIDPTAQAQGGAGQTILLRTGKAPITINYGSFKKYDDGRGHFEQVLIEGLEESKFKVEAKVMETGAPLADSDNPQKLQLSGGVKLTTDDGLELTSTTATWDGEATKLSMPGIVAFKKGRLSGTGTGASYDKATDSFTLLDRAQAHVDVDKEGHGGADLTSSKMTLMRGQHIVQLIDNAKIVGEAQILTSKNATLSFTEDESAVKYLELRDRARVDAKPGVKTDKPTMSADNITMAFYEDGVTLKHSTLTGQGVLTLSGANARSIRASLIDFDLAHDGQTLTSLTATDSVTVTLAPTATTPGRTITSSTLKASGDEKKGLTSARFDGSPEFKETAPAGGRGAGPKSPATMRSGSAKVLILTLGGQIDAIEKATFEQDATFKDGDVTGEADIAEYEEAQGRLTLLPNDREPRRPSRVTTSDMTVDANNIRVNTENDDLTAQGSVKTRTRKAASTTKSTSLFSGDEPIIGLAEGLAFTKSSGLAVYTGTPRVRARLVQGDSQVTADRIEYSDRTRNLNARGNVDSTWLLESGSTKQLKTQKVHAETLAYDETERTAIYNGKPVHVETADGTVEGSTVTFRLAAESRALDTMRARTDVWATLSGGYEAVSDVLIYDAKTDTYTVEGKAGSGVTAQVKSPHADAAPSDPNGCDLTVGMRLLLDRNTNKVKILGEGLAPQDMKQVNCSYPLRKSK